MMLTALAAGVLFQICGTPVLAAEIQTSSNSGLEETLQQRALLHESGVNGLEASRPHQHEVPADFYDQCVTALPQWVCKRLLEEDCNASPCGGSGQRVCAGAELNDREFECDYGFVSDDNDVCVPWTLPECGCCYQPVCAGTALDGREFECDYGYVGNDEGICVPTPDCGCCYQPVCSGAALEDRMFECDYGWVGNDDDICVPWTLPECGCCHLPVCPTDGGRQFECDYGFIGENGICVPWSDRSAVIGTSTSAAAQPQSGAVASQPQRTQTQPQATEVQPQIAQAQPQATQPQPQAAQAQPEAAQARPQAAQVQPQGERQPADQPADQPQMDRQPADEPVDQPQMENQPADEPVDQPQMEIQPADQPQAERPQEPQTQPQERPAVPRPGRLGGDLTFYGGAGAGGACGSSYVPPGFTTVAINSPQYFAENMCGTCVSACYQYDGGERCFEAIIDNRCPECAWGDLDLGESGDGRWPTQWSVIRCPENGPLEFAKPASQPTYQKVKVVRGPSAVRSMNCNSMEGQATEDGFFEFRDNANQNLDQGMQCNIVFTDGEVRDASGV